MSGSIANKEGKTVLAHIILVLGLAGIFYGLVQDNNMILVAVAGAPFVFISMLYILRKPISIYYIVFCIIYLIMGINRYVEIPGISVITEILLIVVLIIGLIQNKISEQYTFREKTNNILVWGMVGWLVYCIGEIFNPHAIFEGWMYSRGVAYYGLAFCLLAALMIKDFNTVKTLVFIYAVLSLMAALKGIMQSTIGFDAFETRWLAAGGAKTHLILTGTRYFSFFTDAGNFGSNMGCSMVVFMCMSLTLKNKFLKIFYLAVSLISLYGLMISGTRGAFIVPFVGFAMWALVSKNFKIAISMTFLVAAAFSFFAFTNIGQSNAQIRRMRTAFDFKEDGSFNVRKENQALLGEFLKDKPFGVGLGLSGVENKRVADVYTTSIPHDSWYVKIWVETGIIGFTFYALIFIGTIVQATLRLLRVRDKEILGVSGGLLCGITGMFISAYGNAFWGQYPTNLIAFTGLIIALNGNYFEKNKTDINNNVLSK